MIKLRSLALGLFITIASFTGVQAQCGTQAPANRFCGNDTGASALATWKSVPTGALSAIGGGTVLGNRTGASAVPTAVTNPVLGIPGTSTGEVGLAGVTSGTAILRAQAAAGSAVSLLPTAAGTLVSTASSPLAVNATTGLMTCPTCVTSSGGGAITGAAPIAVSAAGVVSINAPYVTLTASNGGVVYSGATNLAILAGTATARQMLQSGASTTPAWSTAVWPATTTINQILYADAANNVTGLATLAGGVLNASASGVPSLTRAPVLGLAGTAVGSVGFQNLTSGTVTLQPVAGALGAVTINIPAAAGTMAVSATSPLSLSAAGAVSIPSTTGSGSTVVLQTAPTLITPALGVATGTSLALNGCTIGTSALCTNGGINDIGTLVVQSNNGVAAAVGLNGATNPAFQVDASTASQVAGLKLTGAVTGGTVALAAIDSGTNTNLSIDAKGSGTVSINGTATGAIVLNRATTLSAALTYGGVTLSNAVTGAGNMVLSAAPTLTGAATFTGVPVLSGLSAGTCSSGLAIDASNNAIKVACPGVATTITVGTTTVAGGTNNYVLTTGTGTLANVTVASLLTSLASFQSSSALSPAGTTSGTGTMAGMGSTCKVTPGLTGRVRFFIEARGANSTSGASFGAQLTYGSGAAPANGVAGTGTAPSGLTQYITSTTTGSPASAFTVSGIVTGLSVGTQYWFDMIQYTNGGGTATIAAAACNAQEF